MTFRLISPDKPLLSLKKPETFSRKVVFTAIKDACIDIENAQLVGHDRHRRVPLTSDDCVRRFFEDAELPTVEILYNRAETGTVEAELLEREKDRVAYLEDENVRLSRNWNDMTALMRDLEEARVRERMELNEELQAQANSLQGVVKIATEMFERKCSELDEANTLMAAELQATIKEMNKVNEEFTQEKRRINEKWEKAERIVNKVSQVQDESINEIRAEVGAFEDRILSLSENQIQQARSIHALEATKVCIVDHEESMRWAKQELENTNKKFDNINIETLQLIAETKKNIYITIEVNEADKKAEITRLEKEMSQTERRLDKNRIELRNQLELQLNQTKEVVQAKLLETRTEMTRHGDRITRQGDEAQQIMDNTDRAMKDIENNVLETTNMLRTQLTDGLEVIDKRSKEILVDMEKFLVRICEMEESTAKHVSEMNVSVENCRIMADEGNLATRDVCTEIAEKLYNLKQVSGKHISLIQSDCKVYESSLLRLEQARGRMAGDWSIFSALYQTQRSIQKSVNEDFAKRMTVLYRSLEPQLLEWKIDNVMERKRTLPPNQAMRSGPTTIRGVELQFDWFPNGNGQKIYAPGVCTLRMYAPPCTNIKFEVTLGTYSDGIREWDTETMDMWFEVFFPDWEESIARDTITFKIDIKANKNDDIGSSGQQSVQLYNSAEEERERIEKKEQEMIRRQKESEKFAVPSGMSTPIIDADAAEHREKDEGRSTGSDGSGEKEKGMDTVSGGVEMQAAQPTLNGDPATSTPNG